MRSKQILQLSLIAVLSLLLSACATTVPASERPRSAMPDLEVSVAAFTAELVSGVAPATVYVSWYDNLQPTAPMLADAYVASMVEAELIKRGFTVYRDYDQARYNLQLTMTPGAKVLLTLGQLNQGSKVLGRAEASFASTNARWSQALRSKRYRTTTRIPVEGQP